MIPLLVENLVDWYKWYIMWSRVSEQYKRNVGVHEYKEGNIGIPWLSINPTYVPQYNFREMTCWTFTIWIHSRDGKSVAPIPPKYIYSSGFRNRYSYIDTWNKLLEY